MDTYIKHAKVTRITNHKDVKVADVEFAVEGFDKPLLAKFEKPHGASSSGSAGETSFKLGPVYRNDADLTLDWYNDNLHDAYEDVTAELLSSSTNIYELQKDQLEARLLEHGDVKRELEEGRF
ncbi:hypothetical protein NBRC13296_07275 [Paenibacillus chitinolyticus]|uniref:hypothetical protein n=1 Tax=Paenibacillus chitinolyticus TaxID=79263 RepID=UPI0035562367